MLTSLIWFTSFIGASLRLFIYMVTTSVNKDNYTSYLQMCMFLISIIICIIVATSSIKMLSRSGENRNPCFFSPSFRECFNLSALSVMLAVGFMQLPFSKLRTFPFISLLSVFNHGCVLDFVKLFFCVYFDDHGLNHYFQMLK